MMAEINRRNLLETGLVVAAGSIVPITTSLGAETNNTSTNPKTPSETYGAGNTGLGISKKLTEFTSTIQFAQ